MNSTYLLDQFITTTAGEPYRLFPFGTIIKNGKKRELTPEIARLFKLPHFKPPIKLGSHEDATPAGGHIIGLEVREDGLYAIPEFNDNGTSAVTSGSYRYHSPEVIWDSGVVEDPATGQLNTTPLIWGDALLHTPHLGESAALYHVEPYKENRDMTAQIETVNVPVSFFDRLLNRQPAQEPPAPPVQPDQPAKEDFAAKLATVQAEAEKYRAALEKAEAMQAHAGKVAQFASELKDSTAVAQDTELHELLAGMSDEAAAKLVIKFKALSAQINESNLTGDLGAGGAGSNDPVAALDGAVKQLMASDKIDYAAAVGVLAKTRPELFKEVY